MSVVYVVFSEEEYNGWLLVDVYSDREMAFDKAKQMVKRDISKVKVVRREVIDKMTKKQTFLLSYFGYFVDGQIMKLGVLLYHKKQRGG